MTNADAVRTLDEIGTGDPEGAHTEADEVLLASVAPEVAAAYRRLVARCPWWAAA